MAPARWPLPLVMLALLGGVAYFRASRRRLDTTPAAREEEIAPPSGASPTASIKVDTPYERELQKRLAKAGGQADAIEALVDAHQGAPLNGVYPAERDRWRARQRGCWMLQNAASSDRRKLILGCGGAGESQNN